jgi:hypothetical protein
MAESRLMGRVDGTFLVRLSFRDPMRTPFTISKMRGGTVHHFRVARVAYDPVASNRYEFQHHEGVIYAQTLPAMVEKLRAKGSLGGECPKAVNVGKYEAQPFQ